MGTSPPTRDGDLVEAVHAYIQAQRLLEGITHLLIAVSGGADSLALLVILADLRSRGDLPVITLQVASLDHGIRGPAGAADAQFVADEAARLGIPYTVGSLDVPAYAAARRVGVEDAARQLRYAFLRQTASAWVANRADQEGAARAAIATAHHQEDQAETVLMHLLRGAGMAGLRAMLPRDDYPLFEDVDSVEAGSPAGPDPIQLIRPLLGMPKAALDAFVRARGLQPRIDATNLDTRYLRNRIRHELMPVLRTYNPSISEALAHTAETIQADYAALEGLIPPYPYQLEPFRALPRAVQRMALRARPEWRRDIGFNAIEQALDFILRGKTGRVTVASGLTLCLGFDRFTISRDPLAPLPIDAPALPDGYQTDWTNALAQGGVTVSAGPGWVIQLHVTPYPGDLQAHMRSLPQTSEDISVLEGAINADQGSLRPPSKPNVALPIHQFRIETIIAAESRVGMRTWRPGERFRPSGMGGHRQLLSDLWTNAHVPALWRPLIPLITVDDEVAAFAAPTPRGLLLRHWEHSQHLFTSPSGTKRKLCIIDFQKRVDAVAETNIVE